MVHIRRTPLSEIRRAAVYVNTDKLPLSRIVEEQKPDLAVTAGFYNGKWRPVCPVKAGGRVLFRDERYDYWAVAWDTGPDARPLLVPKGAAGSAASYVANCVLITDGTPHGKLYYNAGVGGRRGRAAVGLTHGGEWLTFASADGSPGAMTPEELRDYMAKQGCAFAIMMDGGGKVNCYDRKAGVMMEGKDPSQTLILLWLNNEEKEDTPVRTKKVCLDAGHDASNKANASPDGTYFEHEFALDMAKRMKTILEAAGVQVTQTRPDGKAVSLGERCKIANAVPDLDLFVSLHSNAAGGSGWSSARGWECYVYGLSGARYEAAKAILARVKSVRRAAIRTTPIKEEPGYYVLRGTNAPAVLIEHGFHTNGGDVALLKDGAYRQSMAEAEAYGILDYLGIPVPEIPRTPVVPEKKTEAELAVEWITGKSIMKGDEDGELMLDEPLTRRQFAVMLYRYYQKLGG